MAKDRKKVYRKRQRKKLKVSPNPLCELCFGEGFTVFVWAEQAIVLPCDCVEIRENLKLEKTLH